MAGSNDLKSSGWHWVIVAFAGGALPFMLQYQTIETVNGSVVHYRDWVAVAGGAVGSAFGVVAVIAALKATGDPTRPMKILISALAFALGGFQIARGFGVFA